MRCPVCRASFEGRPEKQIRKVFRKQIGSKPEADWQFVLLFLYTLGGWARALQLKSLGFRKLSGRYSEANMLFGLVHGVFQGAFFL